jgi:hypothetical protein
MKTYKDPQTGRIEHVEDNNKDVQKALLELGYVEIDPKTGEPKEAPKSAPPAASHVPTREGSQQPAAKEEPPALAVPKPTPKAPEKK